MSIFQLDVSRQSPVGASMLGSLDGDILHNGYIWKTLQDENGPYLASNFRSGVLRHWKRATRKGLPLPVGAEDMVLKRIYDPSGFLCTLPLPLLQSVTYCLDGVLTKRGIKYSKKRKKFMVENFLYDEADLSGSASPDEEALSQANSEDLAFIDDNENVNDGIDDERVMYYQMANDCADASEVTLLPVPESDDEADQLSSSPFLDVIVDMPNPSR